MGARQGASPAGAATESVQWIATQGSAYGPSACTGAPAAGGAAPLATRVGSLAITAGVRGGRGCQRRASQ